jgi:hypothetical protein
MARKSIVPNVKEQKKQAQRQAQSEVLAKQLNRDIDKSIYNAEVKAFYKMSILTNWILHTKFGFGARNGEGRLQKFQDEMAYLCACIQDPACDISIDGLAQQLKDETGYDTVYHLNKRRYNENAEVV